MADDFVANPGSGGSTFAADLISSVLYPRLKLIHGDDGTNNGDVSGANPFPVKVTAYGGAGCYIFRSLDLDESEEQVSATTASVHGVWFTNTAATTRWLKFYNATAANVTVGSTTPVITIALPGNTTDDVTGNLSFTHGIQFTVALSVAATTGFADNDTGAPGANEVFVNIFYAN